MSLWPQVFQVSELRQFTQISDTCYLTMHNVYSNSTNSIATRWCPSAIRWFHPSNLPITITIGINILYIYDSCITYLIVTEVNGWVYGRCSSPKKLVKLGPRLLKRGGVRRWMAMLGSMAWCATIAMRSRAKFLRFLRSHHEAVMENPSMLIILMENLIENPWKSYFIEI